jgi:GNAT superfamily N-acetyltransferase
MADPFDLGKLMPMMMENAIERYGADTNLNFNYLQAAINNELAKVFVVRYGGVYIGYTVFILNRDLFRAHIKQAECLVIYISPDYRGVKPFAQELIKFAEIWLRDVCKTDRILVATSMNKGLAAFYKRLGYATAEIHMSKDL